MSLLLAARNRGLGFDFPFGNPDDAWMGSGGWTGSGGGDNQISYADFFKPSTPTYFPLPAGVQPTFPTGSPTGHSTRDAILGTINNVVPMIAQAFGKNPVPVGASQFAVTGYNPSGAPIYGAAPGQQIGSGISQGLQGGLQGIADFFGVGTGTVLIAGAAGLYLLFRQPPRRR